MSDDGYFGLVLHGHIPWCKKSGTWPAGEEWLFEAMNETYIPMLNVLRELKEANIKTRITINITPILAEQLADDYMKQRFTEYLEGLIKRAKNDQERFKNHSQLKSLADFHRSRFEHVLDVFYHNYYRDINGSFKWLEQEGMVELITCGATHGFLPLFEHDSGIFSQIQTAVDNHKKHFRTQPRGIWLPECAYRPKEVKNGKVRESIDYWLHNSGVEYFFVDSHGILTAELLEQKNYIGLDTRYGYKLETGVNVFGRNKKTSRQVWDAEVGYPGNINYREFHKKDPESGLHYWKITDKSLGKEKKQLYDPAKAQDTLKSQAHHFIEVLEEELADFNQQFGKEGILISPYDFELYGHWWMEGVDWLKKLFELIYSRDKIHMITISDYIENHADDFSVIKMKESSWGKGGHYEVWLNKEHGWIWHYINDSIRRFENVLDKNDSNNEKAQRIFKQTARELLLMEGSDWPFLLYTMQAKEYANKRFHNHHQRFNKLIWAAEDINDPSRIAQKELEEIEQIDSCFPEINVNYFSKKE